MCTLHWTAERSIPVPHQKWQIGVNETTGCLEIRLMEDNWIFDKATFSREQSKRIAEAILESQE